MADLRLRVYLCLLVLRPFNFCRFFSQSKFTQIARIEAFRQVFLCTFGALASLLVARPRATVPLVQGRYGKNLLVAALVLLCAPDLSSAQTAEAETTIGLLASLSGDYATLGNDCRDGFETARRIFSPDNQISGKKLRFLYGDTQGLGSPAVAEFNRLVNLEGAAVLVGHQSQALLPLNPLSRRAAVPLLGVLAHSEFLTTNPYAWRVWPSTEDEAAKLVEYARNHIFQRAAVISIPNEYTDSLRKHFVTHYKARGGTVVLDLELQPSESDFNTVVSRIVNSDAQLVFVNLALNQQGSFVRRLREINSSLNIITNVWAMSAAFLEGAGPLAAEGVVFAQVDTNKPRFLEGLRDYRREAVATAATYCCFTAMATLLQSLESTGALTPRGVHSRLSELRYIKLPDETLEIRGREIVFPLVLRRFKNGKAI